MDRTETYEIQDVETLQLVNDPLRMRLLHLMADTPMAVRDLADALDVPVTRLYYHVNKLSDRGLIAVAETRKAGAMIERRYQTVARYYQPGPGLIESIRNSREAAELAVATVLDGARLDAEAALERHFDRGAESRSGLGALARTFVQLTPEQFTRWTDRITALIGEMDKESETDNEAAERDIYTLTVVFAQSVGPVKEAR